jgi:hypothetical protein
LRQHFDAKTLGKVCADVRKRACCRNHFAAPTPEVHKNAAGVQRGGGGLDICGTVASGGVWV